MFGYIFETSNAFINCGDYWLFQLILEDFYESEVW